MNKKRCTTPYKINNLLLCKDEMVIAYLATDFPNGKSVAA